MEMDNNILLGLLVVLLLANLVVSSMSLYNQNKDKDKNSDDNDNDDDN